MIMMSIVKTYLFTIILLERLTVKRFPLCCVSFDSPDPMQVVFLHTLHLQSADTHWELATTLTS